MTNNPNAFVSVPREPEKAIDALMQFMNALHANVPEDQRPMAWMDFSEEQRARIFSAYRAMLERQEKLDELNAILAAAPSAPAVSGEEELRKALGEIEQAFREINHAFHSGPEWYTRGEHGLRQQVRMWLDRGVAAASRIDAALKRGGDRG